MRRPDPEREKSDRDFLAHKSRAAVDVLTERHRQNRHEGYNASHDDEHTDGSLASAAVCYALLEPKVEDRAAWEYPGRGECDRQTIYEKIPRLWPSSWHPRYWKPKDRRRNLVRAAALILAEIERIDRAAKAPH